MLVLVMQWWYPANPLCAGTMVRGEVLWHVLPRRPCLRRIPVCSLGGVTMLRDEGVALVVVR